LIQGSNSFAVENLTLYANNHKHIVAADLGDTPGAGNVFIRNVRIRGDAYRGHPTPEEVNDRLVNALVLSSGGGDTVRVGGNIRERARPQSWSSPWRRYQWEPVV